MNAVGYEAIKKSIKQLFNYSSVVKWLEHLVYDQHGLGSKHTHDTLQHFPLLGGVGKQF